MRVVGKVVVAVVAVAVGRIVLEMRNNSQIGKRIDSRTKKAYGGVRRDDGLECVGAGRGVRAGAGSERSVGIISGSLRR